MMYRQNQIEKTTLRVCKVVEGETIERKMERMMQQGADMDDVSELMFTERKDGVIPETDIRHDRWETAIEATEAGAKKHLEERNKRHAPKEDMKGEGKTDEVVG